MSWGLEGCNSWGLLTDLFGIQPAQWIAASTMVLNGFYIHVFSPKVLWGPFFLFP
jgi:hypothetical protein